jgi:hypothetical protein
LPGNQRWWDGFRWTGHRRSADGSVRSRIGRALGWTFVGAASLCAALAGIVAVMTLIRQRPLPGGVGVLLAFGIPLVFVGQVWTISIMSAQQPHRSDRWLDNVLASSSRRSPRAMFFGDLERVPSTVLLWTAGIGWLLGVSACPFLIHGGPDGSRADCEYVLSNHGSVTCVSRRTYERAGAAEERLAGGILTSFYCIHIGAVAGSLRRSPGTL